MLQGGYWMSEYIASLPAARAEFAGSPRLPNGSHLVVVDGADGN
jgi:hypothetical protein